MSDKIRFDNPILNDYLCCLLNKSTNAFSVAELMTVTELSLYSQDILGDYFPIALNVLRYFPNLQTLKIFDTGISCDEFDNLLDRKITAISFNNCSFEAGCSLEKLKVENLELIGCEVDSFKFLEKLTSLNSLKIVKTKTTIPFEFVKRLKNLKELNLTNTTLEGSVDLSALNNLKRLGVDYSNIDLMNCGIQKLILEELTIDDMQLEKFKDLILKLKEGGVKVLDTYGGVL